MEDAAIAFVIDYERHAGRVARDTRGQGAAGDVESDGRIIEVKAAGGSARGADLWLEPRQVEEARRNPHFHLYVVDNIRQADPERFGLIDLYGETLARLLQRAKEQRYYTVPFPVKVYDDGRHVPGATQTSDMPLATVAQQHETHPDLVRMNRTSAIVDVLARHEGPMRPVEVWAELRRLGREIDPKGDVSTTMFDLWKAGRIGKSARGQYHALSRASTPAHVVTAAEARPRGKPTQALHHASESAVAPSELPDGGPDSRRDEKKRGKRWLPSGLRSKFQPGGR